MKTVSRSKVYRQVALCWVHTIFGLLLMGLIVFAITMLAMRFGRVRFVMSMLEVIVLLSFILYVLGPKLILWAGNATVPDRERFKNAYESIDELCRSLHIIFRPRLRMMSMNGPNACAFGWGFGFNYIAFSRELYDMMSKEELKGILAHEMAHIRCKDVWLLTILSLMTSGVSAISLWLIRARGIFAGTILGMLVGGILQLVTKVVFPLGISALQQEREYCADALAALYTGSFTPLRDALAKLSSGRGSVIVIAEDYLEKNGKFNPIDFLAAAMKGLMISHPHMDLRLKALESLAA